MYSQLLFPCVIQAKLPLYFSQIRYIFCPATEEDPGVLPGYITWELPRQHHSPLISQYLCSDSFVLVLLQMITEVHADMKTDFAMHP